MRHAFPYISQVATVQQVPGIYNKGQIAKMLCIDRYTARKGDLMECIGMDDYHRIILKRYFNN